MNEIFFRRRRKFYCEAEAESRSDGCLAALLKNLESLGFTLSPALLDAARTLSLASLAKFHRDLVGILEKATGGHRTHRPMYPNFPTSVMEASEAELYLNAWLHYVTGRLPPREAAPRPALEDRPPLRIVELGTREEFESILGTLLRSKGAWSAVDQEDVAWFVREYGDDVARLVPQEIPSKENLANFAALLLLITNVADELIGGRVKTATDVLRIAAALSKGDVSLAKPTRFVSFARGARKRMLSWLERSGDPTEDMLRRPEMWKRLGERLHPGEFAGRFPRTAAAFGVVRSDEPYSTFNRDVEGCLARKDLSGAVAALARRPGELTRRLDHLLRSGAAPEELLDVFCEAAPRVSTPVLLQTLAHFRTRDEARPLRAFFIKGDVANVYATFRRPPRLPKGIAARVAAVCEEALLSRFARLPSLGRCWIDPALKDYLAPFAQRSASKALRTVARGSRLPLPDAGIVRCFLWWRNAHDYTDIDLSAVIFDAEYRYIDVLSYYNLKGFGGCHSGDITDAPEGAAEFIDLDLGLLRAARARYVVMTLHSFSGTPFCHLPECFAGWMGRESAGSGEIFEPRTVQDKVDLAAATRICLPVIFDLETRQAVWADLALQKPPLWNNVHHSLCGVSLLLRTITALAKMDLFTLFSLHAQARGSLAADRAAAQTLFSTTEGTTPFDLDRIAADFM